MREIGLWGL
ncbi:mltA-interacting protein, partial [Yersinia pestis PY-47]